MTLSVCSNLTQLVDFSPSNLNRFKEVYKSKHGKVRIYKVLSVSKESKEWVPNNRACDAPGSWYCQGQYPPGLQKVLKDKRDFKQVSFASCVHDLVPIPRNISLNYQIIIFAAAGRFQFQNGG